MPIDWRTLLADLARSGWTMAAVARRTDIDTSTLDSYRNRGCTPRHDAGERLVVLWCSVTHSTRENAPRLQLSKILD